MGPSPGAAEQARAEHLPAMQPERRCSPKPPTFRAATRTLQPPKQPRLVPLAVAAAAVA
jgi:hypothetical protein